MIFYFKERLTLRGPKAVEPADGAPTHATQAFPHFMHCPRGWRVKGGIFYWGDRWEQIRTLICLLCCGEDAGEPVRISKSRKDDSCRGPIGGNIMHDAYGNAIRCHQGTEDWCCDLISTRQPFTRWPRVASRTGDARRVGSQI